MPRIVRHISSFLVLAVLALVVFHKHIDIVGPSLGLVFAGLLGIYGFVPGMIDRETGRVRHDKAPIPELIRARRRRRRSEDEEMRTH